MTKRLLVSVFFFSTLFLWRASTTDAHAQPLDTADLYSKPVYNNLKEALKNPNSVYRLNLRRSRLKSFPLEILKFSNLQELNLSGNRLTNLPNEIGELKNLQILIVSSNKLKYLPDSIGNLINLQKLAAGKNNLVAIPREIGKLKELKILDLWNNQITEFPDELNDLNKLQLLDLRAIEIGDLIQLHIQEMLPKTKIHFSPSCHCISG